MLKQFRIFLLSFPVIFLLISCASTSIYENQEISLIQNETVISSEKTSLKNGKVKSKSIERKSDADESDEGTIRLTKSDEKVTVESKTNGGYIAYTFLGKPFVILGCSAWELIKCSGYAFINFLGGYSFANDGDTIWVTPDVQKSFATYNKYKEENRIKVYPEYHVPFTDNKIAVSKITYEAETVTTNENEMAVSSKEEYEYDNTLSVKKSVSADAHATFGVLGVIGSIITVPVSVCTWVLGAIYGLVSNE